MLEVLRQIESGKKLFTPRSEGATAEDFNFIAYQLFQAEEDGLIRIGQTHRESESGNDYYDLIHVIGITPAGVDLLED